MTDRAANYSLEGRRVWVAGHRGMVGAAIVRRLANERCEILTATRSDMDLRRQSEVEQWLADKRPHAVFLAAATVGGIVANDTRPAEFLYDNLVIEGNIIEGAHRSGVEKLLFLGSSCIYPRMAPQPMPEDSLLTGPLEPTNQWYAVAKIAGIKLCEAYRRQYGCSFISAMPTNLYGPNDNYDLQSSHVIPALIRKAHEAKTSGSPTMTIWGTGQPLREFMHVDDMADAVVHLMQVYDGAEHVNVGTGSEISIKDLATLVCEVVGFQGDLVLDASKPDGTPRKLMDVQKLIALGWQPRIDLRAGLEHAYRWFCEAEEKRGVQPAAAE